MKEFTLVLCGHVDPGLWVGAVGRGGGGGDVLIA